MNDKKMEQSIGYKLYGSVWKTLSPPYSIAFLWGAYAMKRAAAGAQLPTPWLPEPAKRPDDRAD